MPNWFGKEHPQQVTLKTATVLVGRAPTKQKRIRAVFTLDVGSGEVKGMPDWIAEATEYVMKHNQTLADPLRLSAVNITFGDPNLFKKKPVEAPKCDVRKFQVFPTGGDEPDTLLSFTVYAPFSTDLWGWMGQQAGEYFTATFEGSAVPTADNALTLVNPGTADEAEDEDDDDEDEEEEEDEQQGQQRRATAAAARRQQAELPAQPTAKQVAEAKKKLAIH